MQKSTAQTTIDAEEIARFSAQAEQWWDIHGAFKPLHQLNPVRMAYIVKRIQDSGFGIQGLRILDVGCGGGLVCEPMARLGAKVTGVDASEENIAVAKLHAGQMNLTIDYRAAAVESLTDTFDVVLALEIVEHVADVELFIKSCAARLKPGGLMIFSTINRTLKSLALAKVGAEYVLRWAPVGTHQWDKFVRPSELSLAASRHGLATKELCGLVFDPLAWKWKLKESDVSVNYFLTALK